MKIFLRFLTGVLALAEELSDQTAYRRYLQRTSSIPSCAEWKKFTEHRYRKRFGNAKCC